MTTITIERELLDEIVELFDSAITARFPHEILRDLRAALAAPATALVVTKNESGQIVAVTRQDEDGRIVEVLAESAPATAPLDDEHPYTYASTQATTCASCGEYAHTPLRIDAMGGYVCLTCIDQKLGSLLGEFGYPAPAPASEPVAWMTDEIQPRVASDYTKSNMPSASAVSFSIPLYRVSPATASAQPAWHDAPTVPGLWVCLDEEGNDQSYQVDDAKVWAAEVEPGERWFGPVNPDSGDKQ